MLLFLDLVNALISAIIDDNLERDEDNCDGEEAESDSAKNRIDCLILGYAADDAENISDKECDPEAYLIDSFSYSGYFDFCAKLIKVHIIYTLHNVLTSLHWYNNTIIAQAR